ncbi:hypothetical protein ABK040_008403 [Willaertia magna]
MLNSKTFEINQVVHDVQCYPFHDVSFQRNYILLGGENGSVCLSTYQINTNNKNSTICDISKPLFETQPTTSRITKVAFAPLQWTDFKLTFCTVDSSNSIKIYRSKQKVHLSLLSNITSSDSIEFELITNISSLHKQYINNVCFSQTDSGLHICTVSDDHRCLATNIESLESKVLYECESPLVSINLRTANEIVLGEQYPGRVLIMDLRIPYKKPVITLKPTAKNNRTQSLGLFDTDVHVTRNEWIGTAIGKEFSIFDCTNPLKPLLQQEAHTSSGCKHFRFSPPSFNASHLVFATSNQYDTVKIWDATTSEATPITFKQNYRIGGMTWTNTLTSSSDVSLRKLPCLLTGGDSKLHCYALQ